MLSTAYLSIKSIANRKFTAGLSIITIAISVALLLAVLRIKEGARESFENTLSGTDLIVGPRSGSVQLLLYAVFRLGNPVHNISYSSYQKISALNDIAWTIPIAIGDSHRGYKVLATNRDYFRYYQYAHTHNLEFKSGAAFEAPLDAVVGADVAEKLHYQVGTQIILNHGSDEITMQRHDTVKFTIVGILAPTQTPVDRTVHIFLSAMDAIHEGWQAGTPPSSSTAHPGPETSLSNQNPKALTAIFIGLKSKLGLFQVQNMINSWPDEPLMAILPGLAFNDLWRLVGNAETALIILSCFVVLSGLLGMLSSLLSTLNERRREMAILRAVGALPSDIFTLLLTEAGLLTMIGTILGIILLYGGLCILQPLAEKLYGFYLPLKPISAYDLLIIVAVFGSGLLAGVVPAYRAQKNALTDGLSIRT